MKTRRGVIKSRAKGRRSSILGVKKSPLPRKNVTRRTNKNPISRVKLGSYESPLRHLYHNGPVDSPTTSETSIKSEQVKENSAQVEEKDKKNVLSVAQSHNAVQVEERKETIKIENVDNECEDNNMNDSEAGPSVTSTKRNKSATNSRNCKKRKIKKSPLSRFNDGDNDDDADKFLESVIFLDDSEFMPETKPVLNPLIKETINESLENIIEPAQNLSISEQQMKDEEIVVIDENDSMMEMEAYHRAFNQSADSKFNVTDSIIIIDPDDEPPAVQPQNISPKPSEDCFVVWSSLPKPSTSDASLQSEFFALNSQSSNSNNLDPILKCNKIYLDVNADTTNLRQLNNENNKPSKNKRTKSPKTPARATRTSTLRMLLDKSKLPSKTATKNISKTAAKKAIKDAVKTAAKTATKTETRTEAKTVTKSSAKSATTVKKKSKNNGELIFLSESINKDGNAEQKKTNAKKKKLREIVIDGNNVAMAFTHNKTFSEKGIKMLIDYFTKRGHSVKVFIPQYRRCRNFPLLEKWYEEGVVIFTPSRKLGNKSYTPYDDRYILEYATACNGVVVSQDQFRDLYAEKPQYRDTIEHRLLVPTFVGDYVMFPEDPLGRDGPSLAEFLKY